MAESKNNSKTDPKTEFRHMELKKKGLKEAMLQTERGRIRGLKAKMSRGKLQAITLNRVAKKMIRDNSKFDEYWIRAENI